MAWEPAVSVRAEDASVHMYMKMDGGSVAGMSVVDTRFDLLAAKTLMITLNTLAMPLAIVSGLNATFTMVFSK